MSSPLDYGLWILALAFQSGIAVLMVRRRLHKAFAAFFVYTIYQVFRSVALFAVLQLYVARAVSYAGYFYFFWVCEAVSAAITFAVLYGIFDKLLARFSKLHRFTSVAFAFLVIILLSVSILITAAAPGDNTRVITSILLLNRGLWVVQSGLILLLFLFARFIAIDCRRDFLFGIALGFGILGSFELSALFVRIGFGRLANDIFRFARATGYQLALVAWLLYIFAPRREPEHSITVDDLSTAEQCNRTLMEILRR